MVSSLPTTAKTRARVRTPPPHACQRHCRTPLAARRLVARSTSERGIPLAAEDASAHDLEEMGPVDYLIIEFPDGEPKGKAAPLLVDLVDRGLIRILDLMFIVKGRRRHGRQVRDRRLRRRRQAGLRGVRGRVVRAARRRRPRGGGQRPRARGSRRGAGVREPLGGAFREGGTRVRRPAGRVRPHSGTGPARLARGSRGQS